MKKRNILIIASGVLLLFGFVGYLGWRMITGIPRAGEGDAQGVKGEGTTGLTAPEIQEAPPVQTQYKDLTKLSDEVGVGFAVSPDNGEVYYLTPTGRVKNAKEGEDVEISSQEVGEVQSVEVSRDSERILASFGDRNAIRWGVFDIIDGVWRPLPGTIHYATWGADEKTLLALLDEGGRRPLVALDVQNTTKKPRVILPHFGLYNTSLAALTEQRIIVSELPSLLHNGRVWQLNPATANLQLLLTPPNGSTLYWSQDKKTAFALTPPDGFAVLDEELREIVPVIFTTLPHKCTRSSQLVYCFVPQHIPEEARLPDDYFKKSFFSADELFVVDIDTLLTQRISVGNTDGLPSLDAEYPLFVRDVLYFLNRYDGGVYRLRL